MVNGALLELFIADPSQDEQARRDVYNNWGSFVRAFVSVFEITLANWGPHCWLLMNSVDESWAWFFIIWRSVIGFAVIQVISSVFIQHTFKVASSDEEIMIQAKQQQAATFLRHLDNLFSSLDSPATAISLG